MKKINVFFILIISIFIFQGCKKDKDNDAPPIPIDYEGELYKQFAIDYHQAEMVGNNADIMIETYFREGNNPLIFGLCANINDDPSQGILIIDFGQVDCSGPDSRVRRGKIIVHYSGNYYTSGSTCVITFDNYYVNNNKVEGEKSVTNMGLNTAGKMHWKVEANNIKVTKPNNHWHVWNSVRDRVLIDEGQIFSIWDDVYSITGSASGENHAGLQRSAVIKNPLIRPINCKWFTTGVIELTPYNLPTRILNFGNGACDDEAIVTVGGNTFYITLF